jgi:hypothetical protein
MADLWQCTVKQEHYLWVGSRDQHDCDWTNTEAPKRRNVKFATMMKRSSCSGVFVLRLATLLCSLSSRIALMTAADDKTHHDNAVSVVESSSALFRARQLVVPDVVDTTDGESENHDFWSTNAALLRAAWQEWEESNTTILPSLTVRDIIRVPPEAESSCWQRIAPDVYRCDRFLTPMGTVALKTFIDMALQESGVPRRRPNGMNRFGGVFYPGLDGSVDGAIALSAFEEFYTELLDDYIRPLGRHFYPSYIHHPDISSNNNNVDDGESYAFTIRYKAGEDVQLQEHTDASLYTININLNTDDNETNDDGASTYDGSRVYFVTEEDEEENDDKEYKDARTRKQRNTTTTTTMAFAPGSAVLHLGQIRHGTMPLTKGERTNLVIWVYGPHGFVRIRPYDDTSDEVTDHNHNNKFNNDDEL